MRKFKHKKTGLEATQIDNISYKVKYWLHPIPASIVENSEDWEEIIQRDYEILRFNYLCDKTINGWYAGAKQEGFNSWKNEDWMLKHYDIKSIRRLSDGEVFSLRDQVALNDTWNNCFIEGFKIDKDGALLFLIKDSGATGSYSQLDRFYKVNKKLLHTTEDNYDILDKEELVYLVNPKTCAVTRITFNVWDGTRLLFKTKEGLNKWLLWNKPVLSLQDMEEEIKKALIAASSKESIKTYSFFIDGIKNLAKSKL